MFWNIFRRSKADGTPLEELDLTVHSFNILLKASINTVEELTQKTYGELQQIENCNQRVLDEIISKLENLGLALKD